MTGIQLDSLRHTIIRIRSKFLHLSRDSNVTSEIGKIRNTFERIRTQLRVKDDAMRMLHANLEQRLRRAEQECATLEQEKQCMEEHCARTESRMVEKRRQWSEDQGTMNGEMKILKMKCDEETKKVEELRVENLKLVRLHK
ncbi:unnamed protein product [Echinostoma caproni]|uniref:Uncharacterized protein n=1 Tax=Echinostoma caproni TaxID=27848 RepID=A0A3P8GT34_9TREM|nr:unnamed protein product [Echinostoma caproni]